MGRGTHGNHVRGEKHHAWRGGNPIPDPVKRRENAKSSAKLYPERRRARERVKDAIRAGVILPAKDHKCHDCPDRAVSYDHYEGYSEALKIQPVCHKCHGRRSRERGEHKKENSRRGILYRSKKEIE
jgi:hypothetical protein